MNRIFLRFVYVLLFFISGHAIAQEIVTPENPKPANAPVGVPPVASAGNGAGAAAAAAPSPTTNESSSQIVIFANGSASTPEVAMKDIVASGGGGIGLLLPRFQFLFEVHKGTNDRVGATLDSNGNTSIASKATYGYTLLNPSAASTSYGVEIFWFSKKDLFTSVIPNPHVRWILGVTAMSSSITWMYPGSAAGTLGSRDVTTFAFAACSGFNGRSQLAIQSFSLHVYPCFAWRRIGGDIAGDGDSALRTSLIGTTSRNFVGPEFDIGAQLGNLALGADILYLVGGGRVDGLTDMHFILKLSGNIPVGIPL